MISKPSTRIQALGYICMSELKPIQAMHRTKVGLARETWNNARSIVNTWAIENGLGYVCTSELKPILAERVPLLIAAEDKARTALDTAEQTAIDAWCAYRGTHGLLFWINH